MAKGMARKTRGDMCEGASVVRGRGVRDCNGTIGAHRHICKILDFEDVLRLEAPALALLPPFALPDRNCGLECVDAEAGCGEGFGPMRRRSDDNNGAIANDKFADPVDHDETPDGRPATASFGRERGEARRDLGFVGLVFEPIDGLAVTAVITGDSGEQHDGATVRTMRPLERGLDRKRHIGDADPVVSCCGCLHNPHGIRSNDWASCPPLIRPRSRMQGPPVVSLAVTGFDDDEDGPEEFRPAPHPDDRLWRHPSEIAAEMAARAAAESAAAPVEPALAPATLEVPSVGPLVAAERSRQRLHRGLFVTAIAVAVGASALAAGVLTARSGDEGASQFDLLGSDQTIAVSVSTEDNGADGSAADSASGDRSTRGAVSTVAAITEGRDNNELADRLHATLAPSLPRVQAATAQGMREGSGLFVSDSGLIVTSAGLVADSDYLLAWTNDGRRWHADLVAVDWFSDVAILQVEATSTPANFADAAELWSGQFALAIDHEGRSMQLGEVASVSASAPWTEPGDQSSRVSIGAPALPGSAVVDDAGRVIGMVNQSPNGATGLHATPAWMVERVVAELLADGVADHPWLGIQAQLDASGTQARVVAVVDGSPADLAGLRAGDLVDSIDGERIGASMSLWTLVQMHQPGDQIALAVTRNGERRLVWATLKPLDG